MSEDVCPDILPRQLWRLATQDVHLHRLLKRPQIEFGVPASTIEARQVTCSDFFCIQQCRDNDDISAAKFRLLNLDARLADREQFSKSLEVLPLLRANEKGLRPFDDTVAFGDTFTAPEVRCTVMIEANDALDSTLIEQIDFVSGAQITVCKHNIAGAQHLPQLAKHSHFAAGCFSANALILGRKSSKKPLTFALSDCRLTL